MGMMDEVKTKKKLKAAQNWFDMAETAKNQEKQIEYYTKSLDANPYNAEAWFRRGRIMEQMGLFNDAQKSFEHAIEIDPDYQGLIGRRTNTSETSASTDEAQEFSELEAAENVYQEVYQENETNEEWMSESFETEDNGFTPPIGDESIFAGLGSNNEIEEEEEGNVHDTFSFAGTTTGEDVFKDTSAQADQEVTFAAVSGAKEEEKEIVFSTLDQDENVETFTSPEPATTHVPDVQTQNTPIRKQKKKVAGKPESDQAYNKTSFDTGMVDGGRTADIRIPLNETLRFWLVGIVAIIIAFKILEFI